GGGRSGRALFLCEPSATSFAAAAVNAPAIKIGTRNFRRNASSPQPERLPLNCASENNNAQRLKGHVPMKETSGIEYLAMRRSPCSAITAVQKFNQTSTCARVAESLCAPLPRVRPHASTITCEFSVFSGWWSADSL